MKYESGVRASAANDFAARMRAPLSLTQNVCALHRQGMMTDDRLAAAAVKLIFQSRSLILFGALASSLLTLFIQT